MSDDQSTPLNSARVNTERFDTELAAVWYAANYYYETSLHRRREYCGVVFREQSGRVGITVRSDGTASHATVRPDVPVGSIPIAVWHTHLPAAMSGENPGLNYLYSVAYKALLGVKLEEEFSDNDKNFARTWTRKFGRSIPIYLVTATVIKRYGGMDGAEGVWAKDLPSRMKK